MSEAPASAGERLRAERLRRGLSTQKAADDLHLDAWMIEALENGEHARLGPAVYGKGHLKRYALLLGLPPDEIAAGYAARAETPSVAAVPELHRGASLPRREPSWAAIGGGLAAAGLIAALVGWRMLPSRASSEQPVAVPPADTVAAVHATDEEVPASSVGDGLDSPPSHVVKAVAVATAAPTGATATQPIAVTDVPGPAAGPVAGPVPGLGRARLRLSFSADSWVDVRDASGRRLFAGNGRANSVQTIAGEAPMKVYLGFASGVQLEVNSRAVAIGRQFVAGDVARFEAGADGVLRRDAHAAAASPHPRG